MISDEERRRAVAELREASTGAYRHVDVLDVIANSIGVEIVGKLYYEAEKEIYAALADLIDRPTCEMGDGAFFNGRNEYGAVCSNCECAFEDAEEAHTWHYCPNCGAEVMD